MYEIYLAESSCDEEWDYLGTVQASSEADALQEAKQRWPEYGQVIARECENYTQTYHLGSMNKS